MDSKVETWVLDLAISKVGQFLSVNGMKFKLNKGKSKVLSDGIHSLLGQFTDLTFSSEENKNKVIRCGFFNLINGIFWVLCKKFD